MDPLSILPEEIWYQILRYNTLPLTACVHRFFYQLEATLLEFRLQAVEVRYGTYFNRLWYDDWDGVRLALNHPGRFRFDRDLRSCYVVAAGRGDLLDQEIRSFNFEEAHRLYVYMYALNRLTLEPVIRSIVGERPIVQDRIKGDLLRGSLDLDIHLLSGPASIKPDDIVYIAAIHGNTDFIRQYLKHGQNLHLNHALMAAVRHNHLETIKLLVKGRRSWYYVAKEAVRCGHLEIIKAALSYDVVSPDDLIRDAIVSHQKKVLDFFLTQESYVKTIADSLLREMGISPFQEMNYDPTVIQAMVTAYVERRHQDTIDILIQSCPELPPDAIDSFVESYLAVITQGSEAAATLHFVQTYRIPNPNMIVQLAIDFGLYNSPKIISVLHERYQFDRDDLLELTIYAASCGSTPALRCLLCLIPQTDQPNSVMTDLIQGCRIQRNVKAVIAFYRLNLVDAATTARIILEDSKRELPSDVVDGLTEYGDLILQAAKSSLENMTILYNRMIRTISESERVALINRIALLGAKQDHDVLTWALERGPCDLPPLIMQAQWAENVSAVEHLLHIQGSN